jgi:Winged helix DNA-binding domain
MATRVIRAITAAERRARLGRRHALAEAVAGPVAAAESIVALHSTDPASVYLSAWARSGCTPDDLAAALYEDRTLVRMLGMRRTVYVVPTDLVPVVQHGSADAVAEVEHRKAIAYLNDAAVPNPKRWLAEVKAFTLAALERRGEAPTAVLTKDVPTLGQKIVVGAGTRNEAEVGMSSRVMFLLAAEGLIVRGRPRGTWISTQHVWAPAATWLPGGVPPRLPADEARAELAGRWLRRYGPGTVADLKWWTGWTLTQARAALAALDTVEVDLDGVPGVVLADDVDAVAPPDPWVALLPTLDPTVMGWTGREWYLGSYGPELFDRAGNPGPTIWSDGRIVGGWAQRADGEIATHLFEDVGRQALAAIEARAAAVADWLGPVRVIPRFRTPLEKKLTS